MIKIKPIRCSQCGAIIDTENIIGTDSAKIVQCEYCGANLEISGYSELDGMANINIKVLLNDLEKNSVSTNYHKGVEEDQRARGVGSGKKTFFYFLLILIISSLFLLPEALNRVHTKSVFDSPDIGLLMFITVIDGFAIPMALFLGISLRSGRNNYR